MRIDPAPPASGRIDLIDVARGIAIVAMVIYHLSWDLEFFGLVGWPVDSGVWWRAFAAAIAGTFLFVAGVSLVLAHGLGTRWRAFARRFAVLVAAAGAVSLAMWVASPGFGVYFGILHAIAAASILALPFARLPAPVNVAIGCLLLALPAIAASPAFDHPALLWLGLGTAPPPPAADYVPVLPWAGATFLGMAAARIALAARETAWWSRVRAVSAPARAIAWAGRKSLWIYLVHQPVLMGAIGLVAFGLGTQAQPGAEAQATFMASCETNCAPHMDDPRLCRPICACTVDELRAADLWDSTLASRLSPDEQSRVDAIVGMCRIRAETGQ